MKSIIRNFKNIRECFIPLSQEKSSEVCEKLDISEDKFIEMITSQNLIITISRTNKGLELNIKY